MRKSFIFEVNSFLIMLFQKRRRPIRVAKETWKNRHNEDFENNKLREGMF